MLLPTQVSDPWEAPMQGEGMGTLLPAPTGPTTATENIVPALQPAAPLPSNTASCAAAFSTSLMAMLLLGAVAVQNV